MTSTATPPRTGPRPGSVSPLPQPGDPQLLRRLDQVRGRIRLLHGLSGASRLVTLVVGAIALLYAVDRFLGLPLAVRGVVLVVLVGLAGREFWRRLGSPLLKGPNRADAARLVERAMPACEGRLITALQVGEGPEGSLEQAVVVQAAQLCERSDLREVLTARPSLREAGRAAGAVGLVAVLVFAIDPHVGVFLRRWALEEVPWPRLTHLTLHVPDRGASHVRLADGTLIVARGGTLDIEVSHEGREPNRVELVVSGERGERRSTMTTHPRGTWRGHAVMVEGDTELYVRGGDDDGDDPPTRAVMRVVDPPRLSEPRFTLHPPAYLDRPVTEVGPEQLVVPEGTRVELNGTSPGTPVNAVLWLTGVGERVDLAVDADVTPARISGSFVAEESESLFVQLSDQHGLSVPDPTHYALLVHRDRPPTCRVFAPARSDVKVTERAVVLFGVLAADDQGVASVSLNPESGPPRALEQDPEQPDQFRLVLDLVAEPEAAPGNYSMHVTDRRELPGGRGAQAAIVDGRRVDVVDDAEVQRLLADRQLRLKEAFRAARDRQQRAIESTDDLLLDPPAADDPDLVAAAVAQAQVTLRVERETRELCAIVDETIFNRLDPGPGAPAVLTVRLGQWHARPVDAVFDTGPWGELADAYAGGDFGRLDVVGRLLDMAALAIRVVDQLSPRAHELLDEARSTADVQTLKAARDAQVAVDDVLRRLLERMDEWEDYQEVLSIVEGLIGDQQSLRKRAQDALSTRRSH